VEVEGIHAQERGKDMQIQEAAARRDDRFSPRARLGIMVLFAIASWLPIGAVCVAAA
jgi:hypothetical protein